MCCAEIPSRPYETVGQCSACGEPVDAGGESTLEGCEYSPTVCKTCGDCPCDGSC